MLMHCYLSRAQSIIILKLKKGFMLILLFEDTNWAYNGL